MIALFSLLQQSLTLNGDVWLELISNTNPRVSQLSFWIVGLAGLSEALAQSAVLFLNQVRKRRFIFSLIVNSLIFFFGYLFYVTVVGLTAFWLFEQSYATGLIFAAIALAYAPLTLNILKLIPYFGRTIGIILSAYHFMALMIAVTVLYDFDLYQAMFCVVLAWLLFNIFKGTIGRPLVSLARMTRNKVAGIDLRPIDELEPFQLVEEFDYTLLDGDDA